MKKIFLAAALTIAAAHAQAATVTETTDFENQATGAPLTASSIVYNFPAIDAYSISGSLNADCEGFNPATCSGDNSDVFSFVMGPNRKIENAFLTISNATSTLSGFGFPDALAGLLNLTVGSGATMGFAFSDFDGDGTFASSIVTSLPEGLTHSFGVSVSNGVGSFGFANTLSLDWEITFDVVEIDPSPVPLPASALFLLAGLGGLGLTRRRAWVGPVDPQGPS